MYQEQKLNGKDTTVGTETCNCKPRCLQCSKETNGLIFLTSFKNSSCVSITGNTSNDCMYDLQDSARPVHTSALYNKIMESLTIKYKGKVLNNTLMQKIYTRVVS